MIFRSPWPDIDDYSGSICDLVLGSAAQRGSKAALIESETGETVNYDDLLRRVDAAAAGLVASGLRPGEPFAIALPNCVDFVIAWFAALSAGGWVIPINPLYTAAELGFQIRDSGARFLLTTQDRATAMQGEVENLFVSGGNWKQLSECRLPPPAIRPKPEDLAALPYSSGTTGKPKGVILTHAHVVTNIRQQLVSTARHDDVIVTVFPMFHIAGLNAMLNSFLTVGATVVLMRRFDLERFLELNQQYGGTVLGAPPPVVLALTKSPLWEKFRLNKLRWALCGAAPLGPDLHEAFERRTGLPLDQVWGMTEAACSISGPPPRAEIRKPGSCGTLLPSCEARVVDVISQEPLGIGQAGEIQVRGPNMMRGYWKQPAATAETLIEDGWMRTGDIGYFDSDGCVFLVDRLKELIKYNAYQVAPAELEDVIEGHPAVLDAAVVGAPDASAGEIPVAFVVVRQGAAVTAQQLMDFVAGVVAPHKKIRRVEFVSEIPKSPAGKILRRVLKERVRAQQAATS